MSQNPIDKNIQGSSLKVLATTNCGRAKVFGYSNDYIKETSYKLYICEQILKGSKIVVIYIFKPFITSYIYNII